MKRLRISHGVIRRDRRVVLDACSIDVALPTVIGIVGINGSGKSSLFMALAGVLRTGACGRVTVGGNRIRAAWAPQLPALPEWLTVERTARLYGLDFRRLTEAMPALYLDELAGRRTNALSIGQRQALSFALALGRNAQVMLLDEPFAALDYRRRLAALDLLRAWRDGHADRAILVSSQSSADLSALCDHFVVLRDGRCVFNGPRARLAGDGHAGDGLAGRGPDGMIERNLLALLA